MIGYYVHHHGRGHSHRALALARSLDEPVTGLSSLPPPPGWTGDWVLLDRDDRSSPVADPTANGRLHWVPTADPGLRSRTAQLSRWLDEHRPRLMVVDVSVEVALLARLHGVPVLTVVLPGHRADPAHLIGFDVSTRLVGMWPPTAHGMLPGLPSDVHGRVHTVGAVSRYPVGVVGPRPTGPRRVLLMTGAGGDDLDGALIERARRQTPDWEWVVLGRHGHWDDDPSAALANADVVVTNAGQNSLAEVAAARRPAIVIPQERPYEEQRTTAAVLAAGGWPVLVEDQFPASGWAQRLDTALGLDGAQWSTWCDGGAAGRFADLVTATADHRAEPAP
jgi:Glycosyltransferase family 28 C-terminal domain